MDSDDFLELYDSASDHLSSAVDYGSDSIDGLFFDDEVLPSSSPRELVISGIESMLEVAVDALLKHEPMSLRLHSRGNYRNSELSFPATNSSQAWRFTVLLRLLAIIHDCVTSRVTRTKRDIYYSYPDLFGSQATVDQFVDDIAFSFGVSRIDLGVVAGAKGLAAGQLVIEDCQTRDNVVDARHTVNGVLIPPLNDRHVVQPVKLRWILVVEKEAVFHSLLDSQYFTIALQHGILLTGKGYPDVATRAVLHRLNAVHATIPVFCLTDYDPHGMSIFKTYRSGSKAMAHEAASLVTPALQHLGISSSHVASLAANDESSMAAVMKLTQPDFNTAFSMLKRENSAKSRDRCVMRELQIMMMLGVKVEIEGMHSVDGLARWIIDVMTDPTKRQ